MVMTGDDLTTVCDVVNIFKDTEKINFSEIHKKIDDVFFNLIIGS